MSLFMVEEGAGVTIGASTQVTPAAGTRSHSEILQLGAL